MQSLNIEFEDVLQIYSAPTATRNHVSVPRCSHSVIENRHTAGGYLSAT